MAREVPRDQPLTKEDREYLLARGYDDVVAQIDQNYPGSETKGSQVTGSPVVVEDDVVDDEPDYDAMTGPELEAELRRRSLPISGTNAQKAERLRADDAESAQQ